MSSTKYPLALRSIVYHTLFTNGGWDFYLLKSWKVTVACFCDTPHAVTLTNADDGQSK